MAKDTEKLIRQLSLISYLMAERRPVIAQEIRRDVEGYSAMNEDAFARRFYADRSERRYGQFYREIPLPDGTNADQAKAQFNNGVLEVSLPLPEQSRKRREIPIEGSSTSEQERSDR